MWIEKSVDCNNFDLFVTIVLLRRLFFISLRNQKKMKIVSPGKNLTDNKVSYIDFVTWFFPFTQYKVDNKLIWCNFSIKRRFDSNQSSVLIEILFEKHSINISIETSRPRAYTYVLKFCAEFFLNKSNFFHQFIWIKSNWL